MLRLLRETEIKGSLLCVCVCVYLLLWRERCGVKALMGATAGTIEQLLGIFFVIVYCKILLNVSGQRVF